MRRLSFALLLGLIACGGDPDYVQLFEDATTVEACESPTTMCKDAARASDACGGDEVCKKFSLADCDRKRAQCIWRIEQPDDEFPCPNQVCGEACTALDGTTKACSSLFECVDDVVCL